MAQIVFIGGGGGALDNPEVLTEAGATHLMANADTNTIYRCTAGGGCIVTVPAGLDPGTTTEFVRLGGALTIATSGGLTLVYDSATFSAAAAAVGSSFVISILTSTTALVRGDLAAA